MAFPEPTIAVFFSIIIIIFASWKIFYEKRLLQMVLL